MTADQPLVSVILPTHNRGHVLRRSLHSVLNQTYRNIEVIVVDDASEDDTPSVMESFADSRIRYLRHEHRRGAPAARNTGIAAASADFIAFQDSDDEWLFGKLEKQMAQFVKQDDAVGVVYCGFLRIKNNAVTCYPPTTIRHLSGNILPSLLHGNFVTTQAAIIRKACFSKVGGFDESLPRYQDWELFIRIAQSYNFHCINEPLLLVFHSAESITSNSSKMAIALRAILHKHHDQFMTRKKIYLTHKLFIFLSAIHLPIFGLFNAFPASRKVIKYFLGWH